MCLELSRYLLKVVRKAVRAIQTCNDRAPASVNTACTSLCFRSAGHAFVRLLRRWDLMNEPRCPAVFARPRAFSPIPSVVSPRNMHFFDGDRSRYQQQCSCRGGRSEPSSHVDVVVQLHGGLPQERGPPSHGAHALLPRAQGMQDQGQAATIRPGIRVPVCCKVEPFMRVITLYGAETPFATPHSTSAYGLALSAGDARRGGCALPPLPCALDGLIFNDGGALLAAIATAAPQQSGRRSHDA